MNSLLVLLGNEENIRPHKIAVNQMSLILEQNELASIVWMCALNKYKDIRRIIETWKIFNAE